MAEFPDVAIGSSDPLDLCKGLALLPGLVPARAGVSNTHRAETLFDTAATVVFTRLRVSAFYEILIGLCGPSAAFLFDPVAVTTSEDGTLTLDFSRAETEFQAGLFAGFTFGAGAQIAVDLYLPSAWYSPWKFKWTTVFASKAEVEFDFIELFAELIAYLLDQAAEDDLIERDDRVVGLFDSGILSTWSFLGEASKALLEDPPGRLAATPSLTIPINIVDFIGPMKSLNAGLHKVKGELAFGPTVTLAMPVDLAVEGFTVAGGQGPGSSADYGDLRFEEDTIIATGPPFTTVPDELTTNVSFTAGFDFAIGWYVKVSACNLFELSAQVTLFDLIATLGLPAPTLGTVRDRVSTFLEGGCVLVPGLGLSFGADAALAGAPVTGTVTLLDLARYEGAEPLTITLEADPPIPGFPPSVQILPGASPPRATFVFTPVNQCVEFTEADGTVVETSPTPTSPYATVTVTARAGASFESNCNTALEVTQPLRVQSRVIGVELQLRVVGEGPVWNEEAGAQVNANPDAAPPDVFLNFARFAITWDGPRPSAPVPIAFTLLDEQRNPVPSLQTPAGPDPSIAFDTDGYSQDTVFGFPSTLPFSPQAVSDGIAVLVTFATPAQPRKFANRYVLVIDAGCDHGQNVYWFTVWNWAGNPDPGGCDG
jgi:hypothetical protein